MVKIFYYRFDQDYSDIDIWVYSSPTDGVAYQFTDDSPFGMMALLDIQAGSNFIIRHKDWLFQEKTFKITLSEEYYVVEGDEDCYSSLESAIFATQPRIKAAILKEASKIELSLSNESPVPVSFYLRYKNQIISQLKTEYLSPLELNLLIDQQIIADGIEFLPDELLEVCASNYYAPCLVKWLDLLDNYAYAGNDLGLSRVRTTDTTTVSAIEPFLSEEKMRNLASQSADSTAPADSTYPTDPTDYCLRVWSPVASKIDVCFYKKASSANEQADFSLQATKNLRSGVFSCTFSAATLAQYHYYLYKVHFYPNTPYEKIVFACDPYAQSVSLNGEKSALIRADFPQTLPPDWAKDERPFSKELTEAVVYETHIRDFTIDANSGITEKLRGKFLGLSEENTYFSAQDRTITTGISHLQDLGITHLHILPVNDFASVDESDFLSPVNRNWGYDPQSYFSLEGSYVSNPKNPALRLYEFRQMVQALHKNGIALVVDVVFNHMYKTEYLDALVPAYYFRNRRDGRYTNGSGVGNELASERQMVRKLIVDATVYWVEQFHLDGLRFDLLALMDKQTMYLIAQRLREIYPQILLYGEPWTGGISALAVEDQTLDGTQRGQGFALFNDRFRDAVRGSNLPGRGFINEGASQCDIYGLHIGIKGSYDDFTKLPQESINYLDVHDNYNLFDHLVYTTTSLTAEEYMAELVAKLASLDSLVDRQNTLLSDAVVSRILLGLSIIFFSQGIPLIQAGTEFLRSKKGVHNSYCSPDEINQLNWAQKRVFFPFYEQVQKLIRIRKEEKIFGQNEPASIEKSVFVKQLKSRAEVLYVRFSCQDELRAAQRHDFVLLVNPLTEKVFLDCAAEEVLLPTEKDFINGRVKEKFANPPSAGQEIFVKKEVLAENFSEVAADISGGENKLCLAPLSVFLWEIEV